MPAVMIVEDEAPTRDSIIKVVKLLGYEAIGVGDLASARAVLNRAEAEIVLLDVNLGAENGLDFLREMRQSSPEIPVIMITGNREVETIVDAIKLGAREYMVKPFDATKLRALLERAADDVIMRREVYRARQNNIQVLHGVVLGKSPKMLEALELVDYAASNELPVLLVGQSGTGKEVFANLIHQKSKRSGKQFVAVNSGSLPETMVESTLFGHEAGSFTGAVKRKIGYIEHADKGTLFLDEISAIQEEASRRLLRVLDTKTFERMGGETNPIKVDFRLISASNRDLNSMIQRGEFRDDILHRIRGIEIRVPSLSERREDIPLFVYHFIEKYFAETGIRIHEVHPLAMEALVNYSWPGNLRELKHAIQQAGWAVRKSGTGILEYAYLPEIVRENEAAPALFLHHL